VKQSMDAYLVLGCGGFESTNEFIICNSVTNPVIDLSKIPADKYNRTLDFLDHTCKMFDRPVYDYNKAVNILSMLYKTYEVIDYDNLINIQRFIRLHKDCGLFLILLMKEDYYAG